nr:hypothetical protein L204_02120 [Cryptococcus depauperatus CBS 7855]
MTVQKLIQFKVSGMVQGVNFRQHTQQEAKRLGLQGHCYNHQDSSVQGAVVGPSVKVDEFQRYLERGPPAAQVHGLEIIKEIKGPNDAQIQEILGNNGGFEVRR